MRSRACVHEAGHGVVAWALGLPLAHICILAEGANSAVTGWIGETKLEPAALLTHLYVDGREDCPRLPCIEDFIAFAVAGEIAETGWWSGSAAQDAPIASKYAARIAPDPAAVVAAQVERAKTLCNQYQAERDRLSRALQELRESHWSHVLSATMLVADILRVVTGN